MRTLCILGIGNIGRFVAEAVRAGRAGPYTLDGIADQPGRAAELKELSSALAVPYATDPVDLLDRKPFVVVEAASPVALRAYGLKALDSGAHLLAMSVGALADNSFAAELIAAAGRAGRRIIVPSGAIGGLDALLAARQGNLTEVSLVSTKPPRAFAGAPFFSEHPQDLDTISSVMTLFEGNVADAVRLFPANLNVASTLSLAVGSAAVRVRIVVDPAATQNVHEVVAKGDFGEITLKFANQPSANPGTSQLALYAAIAALRQLDASLQFA